jgi:hypothetical protein
MSENRDRELKDLLDTLDAAQVPAPAADADRRLLARLQAEQRPHRRRGWLVAAAAAVCLAAAVILAITLIGVPGVKQSGPEEATAANVLASMARGLGQTTSLSGTWTTTYRSSDKRVMEERGTFALTAAGDERLDERRVIATGLSAQERKAPQLTGTVWAYDSQTHVAASIETWTDNVIYSSLGQQFPLWPESWLYSGRVFSPFELYRETSAAVRAALAEKNTNVAVAHATYEGRPAWRVSYLSKGFGASGSRYEVVIDRQTGVLLWLRITSTAHSGWRESTATSLSKIVVGSSFGPGSFDLVRPANAINFKPRPNPMLPPLERCSLAELGSRLKIRPLLPQHIPTGFKLTDVAYVTNGRMGGHGYIYMLLYRRGFDRFSITVYQPGVEHTSLGFLGGRRSQITGGAFSGQEARTFLRSTGLGPGLEVRTDKGVSLSTLITGDLSRAQLLGVAAGLRFSGTPAEAAAPPASAAAAPPSWSLSAADPRGALIWGSDGGSAGMTVHSVDRAGTVVWSISGKDVQAISAGLPAGAAVVYAKAPDPRSRSGSGEVVAFDAAGSRVFSKTFRNAFVQLLSATGRRVIWLESTTKGAATLFVHQDGKLHRLEMPADSRLYGAVGDAAGQHVVVQLTYHGSNAGRIQYVWIQVTSAGIPTVVSRSGVGAPTIYLSPDGRWAVLDNYSQTNARLVPFGRTSGRKLAIRDMGLAGFSDGRLLLNGGYSSTNAEGLTTSKYTALVLDRASLRVIWKEVLDHYPAYSWDPQLHYLSTIDDSGAVTAVDVDTSRSVTFGSGYGGAVPIAGGLIVTVRRTDGSVAYEPNPLAGGSQTTGGNR